MDVSPFQQSIMTGDTGTQQDALHEALAAIRGGSRDYVLAAGTLYKIGDEPARKTKTVGHLWWRRSYEYTPMQMFGRGFGGAKWMITWPDGTVQASSNLWHWEDGIDAPDNAQLQQAPFWGNNLRIEGVEHLLAAAPKHIRGIYQDTHPGGFFCVVDTREEWHITSAREKAQWAARPLLKKLWFCEGTVMRRDSEGITWVPEARIARLVRMTSWRIGRKLKAAVNAVICTKCWHWRKTHWVMSDPFGGDIDWGCGYHRVDKAGKHRHCDC